MMQRPDESVVHGSRAGQTAQPRDLPSVDRLLREPAVQALLAEHGHTLVAGEARALLDAQRAEVIGGNVLLDDVVLPVLSAKLQERVQECLQPRMRAVLNLTGNCPTATTSVAISMTTPVVCAYGLDMYLPSAFAQ